MNNTELIKKLKDQRIISREEFIALLSSFNDDDREVAAGIAREISLRSLSNKIFIRGIIEFSSYCKNDCYYCGLRRSNRCASRYRLTNDNILSCCDKGYELGFRTFVLQSGEDPYYNDDRMADIVSRIRKQYQDCAITLSIGEKSREAYQRFFDAGANRYLLRHETADREHYGKLHPPELSLENRIRCLYDLKDIGYQTGCGCMVGSPYQTVENLADDLLFMSKFRPHMIGIGPFIPHKDTPFGNQPAGKVEMTLFMLSLCRIMLPDVLLPATTALGTIQGDGRKRGVLAGANVIMPNLSPADVRKKYLLYDNKAFTGDDAAENVRLLRGHMAEIGYEIVTQRGDYIERQVSK